MGKDWAKMDAIKWMAIAATVCHAVVTIVRELAKGGS